MFETFLRGLWRAFGRAPAPHEVIEFPEPGPLGEITHIGAYPIESVMGSDSVPPHELRPAPRTDPLRVGTMVDPPCGWRYGFPKPFTPRYAGQTLTEWLIEEGVPQDIVDLGFIRFWNEE